MTKYIVHDDNARTVSRIVDSAQAARLRRAGLVGKLVEASGDPLTGPASVVETVGASLLTDGEAVQRVRNLLMRLARRRAPGRSNQIARIIGGGG